MRPVRVRIGSGSERRAEGENPFVVDDGPPRPKGRVLGGIALIGFDDFGNRANGQLGGETKLIADGIVDLFLQGDFVGAMKGKGAGGNPIAGGIEPLLGGLERGVLRWGGLQFEFERFEHGRAS